MSVFSNGNTESSVKTAIVSVFSNANIGSSVKTVPLCLCSVMVIQGHQLRLCHCVCAQ